MGIIGYQTLKEQIENAVSNFGETEVFKELVISKIKELHAEELESEDFRNKLSSIIAEQLYDKEEDETRERVNPS